MNWKTVVFSIIFALIFFDPYFFNIPFGPLRLTLLRLVIICIFLFMLINIYLKKEQLDLKNIKWPLIFYGLWFYYGGMSLIWATNKTSGIKELYYFAIFLMLMIVLIYLLRHVKDSYIYRSFWLIGLLIVIIAFLEFFLNIHLPTSRFVVEAERFEFFEFKRATAFFYNENDLALFLVMIFPFYLLGLFGKKRFFLKVINFLMVLSIFLINFVNNSRLALIALFLQLGLLIVIRKKNWLYKGVRLFLLFLPTILIVSVILGSHLIRNIDIPENFLEGTGSTVIRINLFFNSLYMTFHSFMLGVGPGNYQFNVNPMFNTQGIINPHNWWLEILTNYGLFIFVGYCCFFLYIIVRLYKIYKYEMYKNELAFILFLSMCGFSIACIGPSSLFYFWPQWLIHGVILAFIAKSSDLNYSLDSIRYERALEKR